jgi:murein DD-endopeptidase MepM/ murein hydrolase activator NlpD
VKDNIQANGSYLYGEPNINNSAYAHLGIDYLVRYDTVFSASDGIVYFVGYNPNDTINGYEPGGAGNYIIIQSNWNNRNLFLLYMHLQKPLISQNQLVTKGQPIAISGNTGNSTGPHLHFELRLNSVNYNSLRSRRNPELWCAINGNGAIYGKIEGAPNNTRVDIFPDPKPRPPYTTFSYALTYNFNDPYVGSDDIYQENYAIGDVKPGTYTITALGGLYRRTVRVSAGQVVNADQSTLVDENLISENEVRISQNFPNPFNSETIIKVYVPESFVQENLKLEIFNMLGQKIYESNFLSVGLNEIIIRLNEIETSNASNILFYKINNSRFAQVKKMIYLK